MMPLHLSANLTCGKKILCFCSHWLNVFIDLLCQKEAEEPTFGCRFFELIQEDDIRTNNVRFTSLTERFEASLILF